MRFYLQPQKHKRYYENKKKNLLKSYSNAIFKGFSTKCNFLCQSLFQTKGIEKSFYGFAA